MSDEFFPLLYAARGQFQPAEVSHGTSDRKLRSLMTAMLYHPEAVLPGGHLQEQPVEHLFLPGLYVRQITNPAGSLVVTKLHKTAHPFFVLRGHLLVMDVVTGDKVELVAPCRGVTQPGTQRLIYAFEETVFVTVHPNPDDGQDLEAIEARLIERQELVPGKTAHELFTEQLRLLEDGQ